MNVDFSIKTLYQVVVRRLAAGCFNAPGLASARGINSRDKE